MKKPVVRILLFVVLLGLAIFYFRYTREGFYVYNTGGATVDPTAATNDGMACTQNDTTTSKSGKTLYCCAGKWSSNSC